jgi:integrase
MEKEIIHQSSTNETTLFSELNLADVVEQLKKSVPFCEARQENNPEVSRMYRHPDVGAKPENQKVQTMFGGLNLVEVMKNTHLQAVFSPPQRLTNDKLVPENPPAPKIRFSKIPTADVIASLIRVKKNKRVKVSTLNTYKKRLRLFQQRFTFLPENPEAIMDYLSRFDGESGRHRLNHQDLLNMLYVHATRRFGLLKNPVAELERPIVTHKPVKTLSLEHVLALDRTPTDLLERTALDLLEGHGWRQIEVRRVQAKDVFAIDHQLILCHGKECQELAPVLPETVDRLRDMARDLAPDDFLFMARQTRHGHRAPLGEDGMSQLIGRLLARAGIKGFTGHDLRRTFATLVTAASHDEFLAMRLIRDRVPGLGDRYIRYPMDQLVEGLEKFSPIRQASRLKGDIAGADDEKISTAVEPSPISEAGEIKENTAVETVKGSGGDGGELNSPSRKSCPEPATSIVSSLVLPDSPQLTELSRASR